MSDVTHRYGFEWLDGDLRHIARGTCRVEDGTTAHAALEELRKRHGVPLARLVSAYLRPIRPWWQFWRRR